MADKTTKVETTVAQATPAVTTPVDAPKAAATVASPTPEPVAADAVKPAPAAKKSAPVTSPAPVAAKVAAPAKAVEPAPAPEKAVAKPVVKAPATPKSVTVKTKPAPIAAPAATATSINKEVTIMENTIKNTTDKAQTMFVEMNDRAKAALEKTQGMFADVTEFNKGNVEALVESSKIAAKGIETMGQDAAEYTRKSFEGMTAIVKSLSTVKSPTEFMKLHSDYVRTSFDSLVAESSKTTENMLKLAGEIAQPISNRVAIAAEKIKISA
ncbi:MULTISPECIES: phasin family protein [unclassified Sphingomonas]|uniref:phasin family protein n=1 Tax=unclassified Sphingomonas TaxID=196159 RepID=UPI000BCC406E|nr:MAG: hypothetical protein B7Z43_06485 [Sphingomonas sp. 12-62-6]OYX38625.1 MAG: hypothetical protein B7Y98_08100 [Sphingomonas sp. 32-62-10]